MYVRLIFVFIMYGISTSFLNAQSTTPPTLTASGDQYYCPLEEINIVTDFDIVNTGSIVI